MSSKKIVFLCGYDYSKVFSEISGLDFQVVVPADEEMLSAQSLSNLRNELGDKALLLNYVDVAEKIASLRPDVLISFGWRRIISDDMRQQCGLSINIHPAILPQYKGYHPVPHVLMNNELEHGITAHVVTSDLDCGDIIYQEKFPINKFSTIRSLQSKVNDLMPSFVRNLIERFQSGDDLRLTENKLAGTVVVAGKRLPEDSEIAGDKTLNQAFDEIRACDPERFPAYFMVDGEKVFIQLYRDAKAKREQEFDV